MNVALIQRQIFNSQTGGSLPIPITGTAAFVVRAKQRVYVLPAHPRAQP